MTTEQTYAVDTLREAEALQEAGVPGEHAAAMLYAAIRTSDARFAELRRDISRDIAAFEARVDAKFEAVNAKFEGVNAKFDGQDAKFAAVNDRIDGIADKVSAMQWRLAAVVSIASVSLVTLAASAPDIVAALR